MSSTGDGEIDSEHALLKEPKKRGGRAPGPRGPYKKRKKRRRIGIEKLSAKERQAKAEAPKKADLAANAWTPLQNFGDRLNTYEPGHTGGVPIKDAFKGEGGRPNRVRLVLRETARKIQGKDAPIELITLPGVQPLSAMLRMVEGGRHRIIELLQMAAQNNDPVAWNWWQVYRELPSYARTLVTFDDVCAACGIHPRDLLIVIVSTAMDMGQDVGNLVAAVTHPKVVTALVESAQRIDPKLSDTVLRIGKEDRHAFLQSRGMLPTPKNTQIHLNASVNAQAAAAASAEPSVPKFSDDLQALSGSRSGASLHSVLTINDDGSVTAGSED